MNATEFSKNVENFWKTEILKQYLFKSTKYSNYELSKVRSLIKLLYIRRSCFTDKQAMILEVVDAHFIGVGASLKLECLFANR